MAFDTGKLFISFVCVLISFLAYSPQRMLLEWLGGWNTQSVWILGIFNALVLMIWYNYYLTIITDPGRVPKYWEPNLNGELFEVKQSNNKPRYCRSCEAYKPPRAHHCKQCKRCVLKMDHHCPWTNNCIGHHNYPHFLRFLFYVDVTCIFQFIMMTWRILDIMKMPITFVYQPTAFEVILICLNYMCCVPTIFGVGGLSIYHFWSVACNTSTIEAMEKDKVATLVRRGKIREIKYPYDLGAYRNVSSVLGTNVWLWCFPQPAIGDGLVYQVQKDSEPIDQYMWPPKDPTRDNDFIRMKNLPWSEASPERGRLGYPKQRIRRGSEGYEVRPLSMDDRIYMADMAYKEARYIVEDPIYNDSKEIYYQKHPYANANGDSSDDGYEGEIDVYEYDDNLDMELDDVDDIDDIDDIDDNVESKSTEDINVDKSNTINNSNDFDNIPNPKTKKTIPDISSSNMNNCVSSAMEDSVIKKRQTANTNINTNTNTNPI